MDSFLHSLRTLQRRNDRWPNEEMDHFSSVAHAEHRWRVRSFSRPTYCNICRDVLMSGIKWHGFSCEVCKFKVHKRCLDHVTTFCKWTTLDTLGLHAIYDDKGHYIMPHQWVEGNLPVSAKCSVCKRNCGSLLRLQDLRCLWCSVTVHMLCRESFPRRCPLGPCRISVLPPVAIRSLTMAFLRRDGAALLSHARTAPASPLLVLINSKSGDNQGERLLRRFRQLLNPAQVYDLMNGGPEFGLKVFGIFDSFRVLVGGGDGSVGWVLSALDKLDLHSKCQVGVLPLGTGNDLARVLGWGNAADDDTQLPTLLTKFERAQTKMLDRWSIMMYEGPTPYEGSEHHKGSTISAYEESVAAHLANILSSDDDATVISSAKVLCETVKNFLAKVAEEANKDSKDKNDEEGIAQKCNTLQQKLDSLLNTLHEEAEQANIARSAENEHAIVEAQSSSCSDTLPEILALPNAKLQNKRHSFIQRDALMCRANSLKKAVRQLIEHASRAVDEQHEQTAKNEQRRQTAFAKFRRRLSSVGRSSRSNSPMERSLDFSPSPPPSSSSYNKSATHFAYNDAAIASHTAPGRLSSADPASPFSAGPPGSPRSAPPYALSSLSATYRDPAIEGAAFRIDSTSPSTSSGASPSPAHINLPDLISMTSPLSPPLLSSRSLSADTSDQSASSRENLASTERSLLSPTPGTGRSGSRLNLSSLAVPFQPLPRGNSMNQLPCVGVRVEPPTPCMTPAVSVNNLANAVANSTLGPATVPILGGLTVQGRSNFLSSLSIQTPSRRPSSDADSELAFDRSQCSSRAGDIPGHAYSPAKWLDLRRASTSENCLKDLNISKISQLANSATRNISKCSTKGNVDRTPSPQGRFMPAFRRGLIASGLCGGSLIAEVLLLNADILGVAASPLMEFEDVAIDKYKEKRVMNNYFGIGLDAKIALEFHNKREGASNKARSRRKLFMWYGMLGTKELMQKTYKNLEQKVHLECDGHRIQLPSLQGIVVLNIPSYAGGSNFWGYGQDDGVFTVQSFDDKVLEVVAVFGVIHCATSRVISLQNHRIAQCRHVKIIITGDEPIPVQVDGEAWMQPPGYIQILHKQRAQVLVRNRHFETTLKMWTERQKIESRPPAALLQLFSEAECNTILNFLDSVDQFITSLRRISSRCPMFEQQISEDLVRISDIMRKIYPPKKIISAHHLRPTFAEILLFSKGLFIDAQKFSRNKSEQEGISIPTIEMLETSLISFQNDLKSFEKIIMSSASTSSLTSAWEPASIGSPVEEKPRRKSTSEAAQRCQTSATCASTPESSRFSSIQRFTSLFKLKTRGSSATLHSNNVQNWTTADVRSWLSELELSQYREQFEKHDIRGRELVKLERDDLKELGVEKIGHMKRILQSIQQLNQSSSNSADIGCG